MSDLQCPATLLILGSAGWLPDVLTQAQVACLYTHPQRLGATELAEQLGVPCRTRDDIVVGDDGLPSSDLVSEIADVHRGETVALLPAGPEAASWQLKVDADGWALSRWQVPTER